MVMLPKYLLSTEEVAHWLGVKVCTIRKWTCYGKIPATYIGRKVGFNPDDIKQWVMLMNPQLQKWHKKFGGVVERSNTSVLKTERPKRARRFESFPRR